MGLKDALIITVLGMGVVFIGLLLTSLMIYAFSAVSKWMERPRAKETKPAVERVKPAEPTVEIKPEIIAVITAVLEVEFKKLSLLEGKFTFR
jgi:sodium pump decarboxylase gamma subunit